ncbi:MULTISPECIES: LysR family transcriptional regulator [unclassified Variovorax]|jgi:DNA-binding transcriptional LysR family regulator|uniref:LysR family transcriptional regulator n=1 Tax=unclassified Variovorax TaxID=663243 RepID=UPI00089632D6|nr:MULTISPECIES: LysR substrate-binding domain-containing protein [unclassified Variovorax]SDZ46639.1 DNA-binding transcriptional regulator, LysR family [Variovorax sp. YR634]SDZ62388.1 DNA-binding transcriptional regulator, LysR family [Variovorax sp. YR266]SEU05404.1 DNA-binding transcriptional regulator, LysR family [Variovorax sp. OV084]SOD24463.1 DNA-binding transcriptional regulator, LysR family [Variovorax sp. YR752]
MQGFDLEQLRTLAAVVDAGSLTAAAPRVFLSQSSVSEQIRKLEERAGQSLLTRSKAGVSPTEAGVRLLGYARRILSLSDEAFRDLHGETLQGELRLAVTDYFRPGDLTRLLGRLGESYPQVRLHVTILKSDDLRAAYARGDFDVGVAMNIAGVSAAQPRASVIRRESLVWLGAAGMRLVRGEPVRLLALPDTCSLHQFTVALLRRRRVPYALAHVASGVAGLQSALAAGLGVACLNESAISDGVARLATPHGLPALPRVAFEFLPGRRGETAFVTRARELLATHLV